MLLPKMRRTFDSCERVLQLTERCEFLDDSRLFYIPNLGKTKSFHLSLACIRYIISFLWRSIAPLCCHRIGVEPREPREACCCCCSFSQVNCAFVPEVSGSRSRGCPFGSRRSSFWNSWKHAISLFFRTAPTIQTSSTLSMRQQFDI